MICVGCLNDVHCSNGRTFFLFNATPLNRTSMSPRELSCILTRLVFSTILHKNLLDKFIYKYTCY